jgi:4a-hydroxytetrahydrobiopterin dehydratase
LFGRLGNSRKLKDPNISFGWGNATVSLQTEKIKGLHENDFIMATKIDRIFAGTARA